MKTLLKFSLVGVLFLAPALLQAATVWRNGKTYDFPIYTNNPPGRQLSGGHAPAATPPLPPEETERKILVPSGFEARLFASEPEVVNPVAMTWDERGRLWVLELYEYPKGTPKGTPGRDRIKILEDTDADGRADKVTVFADGYSLATGMALGRGGVYLGAAPNLYFLQDTDGDDKADRETVLFTGFGMEDRHELLNGFDWGPDGSLYMTHGVFTHSSVKDPDHPDRPNVTMDAALARFQPETKHFEVFADGTSNPWGVDWNERGDAFVEACVIHHLFHMAPGGHYNRQGGTWPNPFGYVGDLSSRGLPAITDWRHYRAALAGISIYQGNQYPSSWDGLVMIGNIHQNAINCDRLIPVGSTYRALEETQLLGPEKGQKVIGAGNFMVSTDPWFRPVAIKTGPDGALWIMDWYDKYPCYQNANADPQGVDREYGRIWRVVHVGDQKGKPVPSRPSPDMNLAQSSPQEFIDLLQHPNNWHRRMAQRLMTEKFLDGSLSRDWARRMTDMLDNDAFQPKFSNRLHFLWTLHASGLLDEDTLSAAGHHAHPAVRAWAARLTGEQRTGTLKALNRLIQLAQDKDPSVRAAVAAALRQHSSGSLTANTPLEPTSYPAIARGQQKPLKRGYTMVDTNYLPHLLANPSVDGDFYYPHIVWMAIEPRLALNPDPFLKTFGETPSSSVTAYCAYRAMRRICDISDADKREQSLNSALVFLGRNSLNTALAKASLKGLIKGQESKGAPPTIDLEDIFANLMENPALVDQTRRLATLFGDTSASRMLLTRINDPSASVADRLQGIQAARETGDDTAEKALFQLITTEQSNQELLLASVRAVTSFSGDNTVYPIMDAWKNFTPATRRACSEILVSRTIWARGLLAGVDQKKVSPADFSATARRAMARSGDASVVSSADRLLGRYRDSDADKLKLIQQKRAVVLTGKPDLENGRRQAQTACLICHKLHNQGADVGPDLTGVGRSTLDALLHNVIDPNEIIGNGYETIEVNLKNDITLSGRLIEETDTRIKLLAAGPVEYTIPKQDIELADGQPAIRKTDFSLMPEGLEQLPDKDFRDLIWFILNPPEDKRPWTPELRRELLGEPAQSAARSDHDFRGSGHQPSDGESIALWNPDWKVICPDFEGAPKKLPQFAGRRNVLMTHPFDRTTPAQLQSQVKLPPNAKTLLDFYVAADTQGDWKLNVKVNQSLVHTRLVNKEGSRWKHVVVDLAKFAGQSIVITLENAPNDWQFEFGYWSDISINTPSTAQSSL